MARVRYLIHYFYSIVTLDSSSNLLQKVKEKEKKKLFVIHIKIKYYFKHVTTQSKQLCIIIPYSLFNLRFFTKKYYFRTFISKLYYIFYNILSDCNYSDEIKSLLNDFRT